MTQINTISHFHTPIPHPIFIHERKPYQHCISAKCGTNPVNRAVHPVNNL